MNYQKIYDSIIERALFRETPKEYCETHHIIPKCMKGTDSKDNLAVLTFREHYLCHYLLTKIHPKHIGIQYAFLCMLRNRSGQRILTSRRFDTIKKNFSSFKKWHFRQNNPMFSPKTKKKISERMKKNNPIGLHPEKNRTAQPIRVEYTDGKFEVYSYAKQLTLHRNIPYGTVKHMLKNNVGAPKHKIERIIRL